MNRVWGVLPLAVLLASCGGSQGTLQTNSVQCAQVGALDLSRLSRLSADAFVRAADWQAPRVQGQLLVWPDGDPALRAQSLALRGLRSEPAGRSLRVYTPDGQTDEALARTLARQGLRVQPNYRYEALAAPVPNDPGFPGRGGVLPTNAAGLREQTYLTRINVQPAWDRLYARDGKVEGAEVAVLDTGVQTAHEDLVGLLPGADFCATTSVDKNGVPSCAGQDFVPQESPGDYNGHGTSSVGLIGATGNNKKGIVGVTWQPQNVRPVKVFGTTPGPNGSQFADTASITAGLDWAVGQGAKVVNMSLGFVGCNPDPELARAIRDAAARDVLMVAAAGNSPAEGVRYPASDPLVIAVGAIGRDNTLASYSARPEAARDLDLVAPGGEADPGRAFDILSLGAGGENNEYRMWTGTSEAAPLVAGAASLIRRYAPQLKAAEVRTLLRDSARRVTYKDGAREITIRLLDVGEAMSRLP